jgi:hypothetical protein
MKWEPTGIYSLGLGLGLDPPCSKVKLHTTAIPFEKVTTNALLNIVKLYSKIPQIGG